MTRDSAPCWPAARPDGPRPLPARTRPLLIPALLLALLAPGTAKGASTGCNRARAIVAEVEQLRAAPTVDHRAILAKLNTAKSLCSSLGEIWRYSYCSHLALGDQVSAEIDHKRAVLNGVANLSCTTETPGATVSPASRELPGYVRQKFALVIGIGQFLSAEIPRLQYTAKDARDVADFLIRKAFFPAENVTLLTDAEATRANILDALQKLIVATQPEDLVVLYVSSHGSPSRDGQGLGGIGYLVTYDTDPKRLWLDAIEYQDFAEKAALIPAQRTVTFLDTCFSGQAFQKAGTKLLTLGGLGVSAQTAERFLSGKGSYVITSSSANEVSWESDALHNSYFTHFLLQALEPRNNQPPTVQEVYQLLAYSVAQAVARDKGVGQHPQLHPQGSQGDVRIGVIPKLAAASSP